MWFLSAFKRFCQAFHSVPPKLTVENWLPTPAVKITLEICNCQSWPWNQLFPCVLHESQNTPWTGFATVKLKITITNTLLYHVSNIICLSDPSGTDLTVVFSSSSSSPSRCKPIVNKQPHSSYFSIATHIKYRFRKLMTRTIQWWPRDDTDKDTHKDKYEDKDKDIQEESLPVYISLSTRSSNEYI